MCSLFSLKQYLLCNVVHGQTMLCYTCRYICLHVTCHLFLSLQEAIVSQLFTRYSQGQIYTYIGDILLAVNPFSTLTIYNDEVSVLT